MRDAAFLRPILLYACLGGLILVASVVFDNPKTQGIYLVVPYLSGAANWEPGRGWMYAEADTVRMTALSPEAREDVRLEPSEDLVPYAAQAPGYVYIALAARTVFFWMGDLAAVEWLQVLVHVAITLAFVALLQTRLQKALFFLLYGVNPLILYVATFPYYYFWQVIPSALLLAYLLDRRFRYGWWAVPAVALLAFMHTVRPTMVFVSAFFALLLVLRESRPVAAVSVALGLVCGVLLLASRPDEPLNPWHTAYTGIGAWPNPYVHELSDAPGHELYEKAYGEEHRSGVGGNTSDPVYKKRYRKVTRESYLEILEKSPALLARNAVLNVLGSFSIGYITKSLALSYLSSAVGFAYCLLLLAARRFRFVAAILASCVSFALYFPPVPVYVYGTYILGIGAFVDLWRDPRWEERLLRLLPARGTSREAQAQA
jgi:hypothetical protein